MIDTTILNPANPDHFARVKPVQARVRVVRGGAILAESTRAIRMLEHGRDYYDPVIYMPRGDTSDLLLAVPDKSTHCPLKGDCLYLSLDGAEIAWSYDRPLESAAFLRDFIAFYADRVVIEEHGRQA